MVPLAAGFTTELAGKCPRLELVQSLSSGTDGFDVAALARPTLKHRMALTFAAKAEGQTIEAVIDGLVAHAAEHEAAA